MHFIPSVSADFGAFRGQQLASKAGTSRPHVSVPAGMLARQNLGQKEEGARGKGLGWETQSSAVVRSPRLRGGRDSLIPAGILLNPSQEHPGEWQIAVAWGRTRWAALQRCGTAEPCACLSLALLHARPRQHTLQDLPTLVPVSPKHLSLLFSLCVACQAALATQRRK